MHEKDIDTDMNTMIPRLEPFEVGGKTIVPRTMKVKQLPIVLRAVQPFAGAFTGGSLHAPDIQMLLIEHTPNVVELVHQLTGEDKAWIEELELDEMIIIFSRVVEVNLDFFIRKVLPLLSVATGRLASGLPAATPLPISSSS